MTAKALKKPSNRKVRLWLILLLTAGVATAGGLFAMAFEGDSLAASVSAESQVPSTSETQPSDGKQSRAVFQRTVDGDTITTDLGTIRIIGIDTPERGECGYEDAAGAVDRVLSPGDEVLLELPHGQRASDRYGRLLRYVSTPSGADLGMLQIEAGLAAARYDSQDGYPKHPREAAYRAAAEATLSADRSVQTTACALALPQQHDAQGGSGNTNGAAEPTATPPLPHPATGADHGDEAGVEGSVEGGVEDGIWWTQYRSCSALKRNTVGHPTGPFNRDDLAEAAIYQWFAYGTGFNGDGDDDGLACE